MSEPQLLVALVAAGGILLIVLSVTWSRTPDPVQQRLDRLGTGGPRNLEELELQQPVIERLFTPLLALVGRFTNRLTNAASTTRIDRQLALAGNPSELTATTWVSIKLVAAFLGAVGLLLFSSIAGTRGITTIGLGFLGLILGYIAPDAWLSRKGRARQKAILRALPDTLDLLTISMRAGVGFDLALARVIDKLPGPLADELETALQEMRIGKARRDALKDITTRTDVRSLSSFIGAILQADEMGVPIARVLEVQSQQLRVERRQRAETMAARAPVKLLFPLVGCMLPTLFIVILGPAIIRISRSSF